MGSMNVVCDQCGRGAVEIGVTAADTDASRPLWKSRCEEHRYGGDDGYWLSMDDLLERGPAWWLIHVEGKAWGRRSDFRSLVGAMVGYSSDPRVRRAA